MAGGSSPAPLVVFGAGGHGISVADVAQSAGYALRCFVDPARQGGELFGCPIVGDLAELPDLRALIDKRAFGVAIAVGDNAVRERIALELAAQHPALRYPALVHASAVVSPHATLAHGVVVMAGAVVGPNCRIATFCVVNTRASIDHDGVMDPYASLAPGAVVGGGVHIGARSAVSIGAVVRDRLRIGHDSVLGANSYLHRDLPAHQLAYGVPARAIRQRQRGDTYL
jgi:sugar O-acyltransferase (sialic acid O-acetyltransferase NeuD family)